MESPFTTYWLGFFIGLGNGIIWTLLITTGRI